VDLNLLPWFVAVAEAKSFAAAAIQLGVRRSSVSRGVAGLERELGVQLFSRTTRRVALTTGGEALYAKAAPQLQALKDTLGGMAERGQTPAGTLRVSAPIDLGAFVLAPLLDAFSRRFPGIQLEVRLTNRPVDLVADGLDAALRIATRRLSDSTLVARKLSALTLHLFGSPGYLAEAGKPKRPADLAGHAWVRFGRGALPAWAPKAGASSRVSGDDILFVREAVKGGLGLGLLPAFLCEEEVAAGRLVRILPRLSAGAGALYLVHPPSRHVPRKVIALRDFLVAHFARHPLGALEAG
jgi:DNA-binding transcriptional LysR family regulator